MTYPPPIVYNDKIFFDKCNHIAKMRVAGTIRMAFFPVFLSVVYVVRNQGHQLESIIHSASEKLSSLVTDYEWRIQK